MPANVKVRWFGNLFQKKLRGKMDSALEQIGVAVETKVAEEMRGAKHGYTYLFEGILPWKASVPGQAPGIRLGNYIRSFGHQRITGLTEMTVRVGSNAETIASGWHQRADKKEIGLIWEKLRKRRQTKVSEKNKSGAGYPLARMLELGTSRMAPRPHLRPAAFASTGKMISILFRAISSIT